MVGRGGSARPRRKRKKRGGPEPWSKSVITSSNKVLIVVNQSFTVLFEIIFLHREKSRLEKLAISTVLLAFSTNADLSIIVFKSEK